MKDIARIELLTLWRECRQFTAALQKAMYFAGQAERRLSDALNDMFSVEVVHITDKGVIFFRDGSTFDLRAEVKGEGVSVQDEGVPALSKDDGSVAGG